jgi:hypothetical protein
MVNVTVQVETRPEVSVVETEAGTMVEVRYEVGGTTIDLLLTPQALSLLIGALALAHIEVRDQEVTREPAR